MHDVASLIVQVFTPQEPVCVPQLFIRQVMTTSTPPFTMLNAEGDRRSSAWRTVRICFIVELLRVNIRPIIVGRSLIGAIYKINFIKTKYFQKILCKLFNLVEILIALWIDCFWTAWVWINVSFAKWKKYFAITLAVVYFAIFIVETTAIDNALCLV